MRIISAIVHNALGCFSLVGGGLVGPGEYGVVEGRLVTSWRRPKVEVDRNVREDGSSVLREASN
jgi:hypothetical protein